MMKIKLLLMMLSIGLVHSACLSTKRLGPGQISKHHTKFGVVVPSDQWVEKSFRGADLYFVHKNEPATIFINAQCEKVSDSPLEALAAQLIIGLTEIKIVHQERQMVAEREALISQVEAKIDGVQRFLKTIVLRKNRCVFDAVLSAPQSNAQIVADFDQLINTFWAEADL